jgi:hypothetical protein
MEAEQGSTGLVLQRIIKLDYKAPISQQLFQHGVVLAEESGGA